MQKRAPSSTGSEGHTTTVARAATASAGARMSTGLRPMASVSLPKELESMTSTRAETEPSVPSVVAALAEEPLRISAAGSACGGHAVRMQCACSAHAVRAQCNAHMRCTRSTQHLRDHAEAGGHEERDREDDRLGHLRLVGSRRRRLWLAQSQQRRACARVRAAGPPEVRPGGAARLQ